MVKFNPEDTFQERNYLGYSKGQIPNKAGETLLKGVGSVAKGVVEDLDQHSKRSIERDLFESKESVHAGLGIPSSLQNEIGDVQTLKDQLDQGAIDPAYYWQQVQKKVTAVRQQYPQYRGYIDTQQKKIFGGDSANELVRLRMAQFKSAASELQAESTNYRNKVTSEESQKIMGNSFEFNKLVNEGKYKEAYFHMQEKKGEIGAFEKRKRQHEETVRDREEATLKVPSFASKEMDSIIRNAVNDVTETVGGLATLHSRIREYTAEDSPGGKIVTPEELQDFQAIASQIRAAVEGEMNNLAVSEFGDYGTIAGLMGSKWEEQKKIAMASLNQALNAAEQGDLSLFAWNATMAKVTKDGKQADLLRTYPFLADLAGMQGVVPEEVINYLITQLPAGDQAALAESLFKAPLKSIHLFMDQEGRVGNPDGTETLPTDIIKGSGMLGATVEQQKANVRSFLSMGAEIASGQSQLSPEDASKFVNWLYGRSNVKDFLRQFTPASRAKVIGTLANPLVTERMWQDHQGTPLWDRYDNFVRNGMAELPSVREAVANAEGNAWYRNRQYFESSFDPDTLQFSVSLKPEFASGRGQFQTQLDEAQKGFAELNQYLAILKPIQDKSGLSPTDYMEQKVISQWGIELDNWQPDDSSWVKAIRGLFEEAKEDDFLEAAGQKGKTKEKAPTKPKEGESFRDRQEETRPSTDQSSLEGADDFVQLASWRDESLDDQEGHGMSDTEYQANIAQVELMNYTAGGELDAKDTGAVEKYIRTKAKELNIDPTIAVRVARSEGLAKGVWQSYYRKGIHREPSYGPFQLLKGGSGTGFPRGLGNAFEEETGLDPSDPKNVKAMIDYALKVASEDGWRQWYGAKKSGIGRWKGINS